MNAKAIWVASLLALASFGCSPSSGTELTNDDGAAGGKADCVSDDACDEAGRGSALAQLGLDRFYHEGDEWQVVWIPRNDDQSHRDANQQIGNAQLGKPGLVTYRAEEIDSARFGSVERDIATISVTPGGDMPAALAGLAIGTPESLDERIEYTINDLYNPVAKAFFSLNKFGQTVRNEIDLDGRSNLTMQFDSLPNSLPNLDRIEPAAACNDEFFANLDNPEARPFTACWGTASEVPAELAEVAARASFDATARGVHFAPTAAQPDYMFWQAGRLHPSLVISPRGFGILVSESAE